METFLDVCPLLEGTTNYTQHVTISSDLQLTTRNLPDTVNRDIKCIFFIHHALL